MPRVGVADGAQVFVVASNEAGTGTNATAQDGSIHRVAKFNHGGGFVEILARKSVGRSFPKCLLRRAQDVTGIGAAPGHIEKCGQEARPRDPQELVKITRPALVVVQRSQFRAPQRGHIAVNGIVRGTPLLRSEESLAESQRRLANRFRFRAHPTDLPRVKTHDLRPAKRTV